MVRTLFATAAFCLLLVGCDTTQPVTPAQPADVAGTYDFTQLRFQPSAGGIVPAEVLATVVTEGPDATRLQLFGDAQAILYYNFGSGDTGFFTGTFTVTRDVARITFGAASEPRRLRLLLPADLSLRRTDERTLSTDLGTRVNLEAFAPQTYTGLRDVAGTLQVRLARRTS
jgi:hypothetical protein